jgi:hypothetical protein
MSIFLIIINDTDYTSLFLSSGIVYQLRGDHDSALKLHQVDKFLKFKSILLVTSTFFSLKLLRNFNSSWTK